jgi:hypothetical protein
MGIASENGKTQIWKCKVQICSAITFLEILFRTIFAKQKLILNDDCSGFTANWEIHWWHRVNDTLHIILPQIWKDVVDRVILFIPG